MNGQLYELDTELLSPDEFHAKFSQLTGPSSLFKKLEQKEVKPAAIDNGSNERPLTPVKEVIKEPVSSFSQLSHLLQKRIKAKLEPVPGLTANQQQALLGVVISELASSWSEVRCLAADPFLSNQQNKQVERLLAIEVINIAEYLYFETLDKAKELNTRGVFSSYANSSRLKAQLALEANHSFDIVKIHRRLTSALKQSSRVGRLPTDSSEYVSRQPTAVIKPKKIAKTKMCVTTLDVPPRLTREEKDRKRRDSDLKQLEAQMPNFSLEKVEKACGIYSYDLCQRIHAGKEETGIETLDNVDESSFDHTPLPRAEKRYQSLPNLMVGESLLDELGITEEKNAGYRRRSVDKLGINLACSGRECSSVNEGTHLERGKCGDSNFLSDDLKKLVHTHEASMQQQFLLSEQDQDLPPLLQALNYHSTKKRKVLSHNDLDKDLGDGESEVCSTIASTIASSVANNDDMDRERVLSVGEEYKKHIQPATVSTRIPDKGVVRTSDVRVSNRVNKSDVTLKSYPTVYNDLIDEIDPATVKWLDRNLYIGDEIREVYEEIIKTVGKDHLLFDKDPFVETHASEANFSGVVHSAMLMGNKSDKVINSSLYRDIPPPWSKHTIEKWRNSPMFGELGRQDILNMGAEALTELPGKATKSYNSWLAWWRSTITTDDYFKFLSTQDNDYLSLSYHLYESDDGSTDDEAEKDRLPNARELELRRAREQKFVEIRKLKEKFSSGFWNANSVLIGGLGKYPDISDEELGVASEGSLGQDGRKTSISNVTDEVSSPLNIQDRLNRVWTLLCMPDAFRLDMAIKYSSEIYIDKLEEVLLQWETSVKFVLSRESLITKLEDFERLASDPNRFFEKGGTGSASSRIKEAKARRQFHHNLDKIEVRVKKIVTAIYESFGDIVTFQGRPYLEKMASDRTEMLYWLQQERRQTAFDVVRKTVELKCTEIPALPVHQVL